MILSMVLHMTEVEAIGRYESARSVLRSLFLRTGVMREYFHADGTLPDSNILLNMAVRTGVMVGEESFRRDGWM